MHILMDVDGVLADFSTAILKAGGSTMPASGVERWDIFYYLDQDGMTAARKACNDPEFWRSLPMIEGALEGLDDLARYSSSLTFVTTPWPTCPGWIEARKAWLLEHFGRGANNVLAKTDKSIVKGDLFVDDKPSNIDAWAKVWGWRGARLFCAPYNQGVDYPRVTWGRGGSRGLKLIKP